MQASEAYLNRFESIKDEKRRTYAAMIPGLDDAVGVVLARLHAAGLDEQTLVVFLIDKG